MKTVYKLKLTEEEIRFITRNFILSFDVIKSMKNRKSIFIPKLKTLYGLRKKIKEVYPRIRNLEIQYRYNKRLRKNDRKNKNKKSRSKD